MEKVIVEFPVSVFSALRKDPGEFVKAMRLAAGAKWYELGEISQEKAAEIAGISRAAFLSELARFKIDFMQLDAEELDRELNNGD